MNNWYEKTQDRKYNQEWDIFTDMGRVDIETQTPKWTSSERSSLQDLKYIVSLQEQLITSQQQYMMLHKSYMKIYELSKKTTSWTPTPERISVHPGQHIRGNNIRRQFPNIRRQYPSDSVHPNCFFNSKFNSKMYH